MTPHTIANLIFWGAFCSVGVLVYQGIILPSIRLLLRYRVFELRDQLRLLVIEGKVQESDKSFQLLHQSLNFMCTSLARFDLLRVVQASSKLDEEARGRVASRTRVMAEAPAEVQKIYKESLSVVALTLTFNSFFFFILVSICLVMAVALKSAYRLVMQASLQTLKGLFEFAKDLFQQQVDADAAVAFFSPELATV